MKSRNYATMKYQGGKAGEISGYKLSSARGVFERYDRFHQDLMIH